ncbi:MAG TPA: CBS domain-containing protein [Tissierellaceae bacterium]|nr:CBS domain-containing protein [Tissierellaceae bacterium]
MTNYNEFMSEFNRIEDFLKDLVNAKYNMPFYKLLEEAMKRDKLVKQFYQELRTMSDLRNIIAHGDPNDPVALPSKSTLNRIRFIEDQFTNPLKIIDVFKKSVDAFDATDSLEEVLSEIDKYHYSQFPVVKSGEFIGLITENGITNWLASSVKNDNISIKNTTVQDVILGDEESDSYSFMLTSDTLYDVIDKFEEIRRKKNRTATIIVLNRKVNPVNVEDIYTILTPWDLDIIFSKLGMGLE